MADDIKVTGGGATGGGMAADVADVAAVGVVGVVGVGRTRPPKVSVRNVSKVFEGAKKQELLALDTINLDIAEHEFAVIVGPSGCGKSTLLNIIGGLEEASSGEVLLDGARAINGPGPDRGMVFQNYSLFPWLNVQKNIEFGPKVCGVSADERQRLSRHYIDAVGLKGFEAALPKTLSGGMKQRVAIARTMANQPEVLLMDEPFGALDAQTRIVMQEMLLRVWEQEKTTVVFITHDIDEAIMLGTKIYVMSRRPGRIEAVFAVDIECERGHEMLANAEFLTLKKQIMDMLWEQSVAAASGA